LEDVRRGSRGVEEGVVLVTKSFELFGYDWRTGRPFEGNGDVEEEKRRPKRKREWVKRQEGR
jgi:hypothetical protein